MGSQADDAKEELYLLQDVFNAACAEAVSTGCLNRLAQGEQAHWTLVLLL